MREYDFNLVLTRDLTEDEIDAVGAWISESGPAPEGVEDVTLAVSAGVAYAMCTVRAESFDQALALVLPGLTERGAEVARIELAPDFAHAA